MSYSGVVRQLLISSPGDVPLSDLRRVQQAINRWNGIYGPSFATAVVPISWGTHAAAEFGQSPQEILNMQIVDKADMCIAIFASRLGTPTAKAKSGTAEEIEYLSKTGKYVAILRSRRPVDPAKTDLEQAAKLQEYLDSIRTNALILEYETDAELDQSVDNILAAAVSRDRTITQAELQTPGKAEVWPRVESEDRVGVTSRGEIRTRNWYLVLSNTGDSPARDVHFDIEPIKAGELPWDVLGGSESDDPDIEVLAPRGEIRLPIAASLASPAQVSCRVTWIDERGQGTNTATLRLS